MLSDKTWNPTSWPGWMKSNAKYRCDQCWRGYRWPETLRRHKRYECGKDPTFQCPYCDYKAKRKNTLESHVRCRHKAKVESN